jgi:N-acetylmuramoyl-L-alanine amidase
LLEKDLNLETAKSCIKELEKHGIKVYTSRTGDTYISLGDRSKMANEIEDLDLFISIHHNASTNQNVNRGEVIYSVKEGESQKLAECIGEKLYDVGNAEVKVYNRYNKNGKDYYAVIKNTKATSVIVEICFLTSAEGVALVDTPEKREKNGILVAQGIMDYLGVDYTNSKNEKKEKLIEKEIKRKSGLDIIKDALDKNNKNIKKSLLDILNGK